MLLDATLVNSLSITQVAIYYSHCEAIALPLECDSLNTPFSIDIAPLRGEESAKKPC